MLLLPTFRARLLPCSKPWAALTPTALDHHCAHCQRVVLDFTNSQNPTADLTAARAAAPDGRVCGRFTGARVQGPPLLTRQLRWFLVVLVLVVAQGLSAGEALAQVRQGARGKHAEKDRPQVTPPNGWLGTYIEQMPTFKKKGFNSGSSGIVDYVQRNIQYQPDFPDGKVVVTFTIDTAGLVQKPIVIKGLSPAADAEVIQVIKAMNGFMPGMSSNRPVAIPYTLPITFKKPKPSTP